MAFTAQVICDGPDCTEQVEFKDDSFLVHDLRNDLTENGWIINRLTHEDFCPACAAKQTMISEVQHGHS